MQKLKLHLSRVELGVWYMLVSTILFILVDAFVKSELTHIPSIEVVFFTFFIGLILLLAFSYKHIEFRISTQLWLLILRGILGCISLVLVLYLILYIPLANVTIFFQSSVLFGVLFAFVFLKEKLNILQLTSIFVGFFGIILIIGPDMDFNRYDSLGIILGVIVGLIMVSIRSLSKNHHSTTIIFYLYLVGVVFCVCCMAIAEFYYIQELDFFISKFVMPDMYSLMILFFVGLLYLLAQFYKNRAFASSKAGIVGTIGYSKIVFAIMIGVALGDAFPDVMTLGGIILVTISGVVVSLKKNDREYICKN